MCVEVAKELSLPAEELSDIELLGRLHDIGKLLIDNVLLEKTTPLTDAEFKNIQEHSASGYRIANSIPDLSRIGRYILYHHEQYDGTGYPNKVKGTDIPLQSRILTIADSIDAMSSDRPYSPSLPPETIRKELEINKGKQFDPDLVDVFLNLYFNKEG